MAQIILDADYEAYKIQDYTLLNNVWGKGGLVNGIGFKQSIVFDSGSLSPNFTLNWSWPTGNGQIVSYPEISWGDSPLYDGADENHKYISTVANLKTFDVDVDIDVAAGSTFANVAFDLWLTNKAFGNQSSISSEVMVWLDKGAATSVWGSKIGTYSVDGHTASIYHAPSSTSPDYIAVVFDKPWLDGSIDLKDVLSELAKRNLVSASDYVSGYQLGAEISGGKGSIHFAHVDTTFETQPVTNDQTFIGTAGNDTFTGGSGNDRISGLAGSDRIDGGYGNDVVEGGANGDSLNGGYDIDTLQYLASSAGVTVDLAKSTATGGDATGDAIWSFENVTGSAYQDMLYGSAIGNVMKGAGGADNIEGREGNDVIDGGDGWDRIVGGAGADNLTGGTGGDIFVFVGGESTSSAQDTIEDFNFYEGDRINTVGMDANTVQASYQRGLTFIGSASFTGHAGELRTERTATDTYIYADTDGDKKADFSLHLDGSMAVTKDYFMLT